MENLLLKEFSKNYLIFLDFRAIVAYGSILVEQREWTKVHSFLLRINKKE